MKKPESIQILSWDDSLLGQYQDSTAEIQEGTSVEVQENEKGNPEFTAQPGCVYLVQGTVGERNRRLQFPDACQVITRCMIEGLQKTDAI